MQTNTSLPKINYTDAERKNEYSGQHNKQIFFLGILVLFSLMGFSQVKLDIGKTSLQTKEFKIDKLTCKITPSLEISNSKAENIKLVFIVQWFDKKNNYVQGSGKTGIFIKINNNIDSYCSSNQKTISTKTGMFTKKSVDLDNSITIAPNGTFSISPYSGIAIKDGMLPINLQLIKHSKSLITLKVLLYIGEEKSKTIEIDEIPKKLEWGFFLPEKETSENRTNEPVPSVQNTSESLSCGELEEKYNRKFIENKPMYHISNFNTKLSSIELMDPKLAALQQLKNDFLEYQIKTSKLVALKGEIKNDPKYNSCNNLAILIGSINSYITGDSEINTTATNINNAIANSGEAGSGGNGAPPFELFDNNCEYCEKTYFTLFEIKMKPVLLENHEANYLGNLYSKLTEIKTSQDSYHEQIQGAKENKNYLRKYKSFNEFYDGSLAIILEFEPQAKNKSNSPGGGSTEDGGGSGLLSGAKSAGSKIPLYYIIGPIVILLVAFGIFKYMKFLKKGKNINDKLK
ncbi:MAG: hypothetical protein DRJ05_00915 [Bacteroidetes bacterium]|nr:MAG: hypothetical protein DRJ05_00915 [Bacteroidota bacterium]